MKNKSSGGRRPSSPMRLNKAEQKALSRALELDMEELPMDPETKLI